MKNTVFLLLGTNLGNRNKNLHAALEAIEQEVGSIIKRSSVYETAAWGKTDQPGFLNQAAKVDTSQKAGEVLKTILSIEEKLGRRRMEKWGERIIDIDILFFNDAIMSSPELVIPHPQLANRRFTLMPLNEIAAELIHPVLNKSIRRLLLDCPDDLSVIRVQV